MVQAWFLILVYFFFFVLSVSRTKLLLARIRMTQLMMLNHATCDVYSWKTVEALIQGNVTDIGCFNMCKTYFFSFFGFIEALDLKRILNKLRIDGMRWHRSFNFCYVTNKIVLRLLITFSGAVCKMFCTRIIFSRPMDNYNIVIYGKVFKCIIRIYKNIGNLSLWLACVKL